MDMSHKKFYVVFYGLVLASLLFVSCSKVRDPVSANSPAALSVHPSNWVKADSLDFHGKDLQKNNWDLKGCRSCHGANYSGGIAKSSCLTCHPANPEDCVVCHGGEDNQTGAPPEDLAGNANTDAKGVGAHTAHLSDGNLSLKFDCESCHIFPDSLYAAGHLETVKSQVSAEINFQGLAIIGGTNPQWNGQTCTNTYCHGGFNGGNSTNAPKWTTVDNTQAACGTCHNLPPGGEHPQGDVVSQCNLCHGTVVDDDNNIISKSLHINGMPNVIGTHPTGWVDTNSPDFHGIYISDNQWDLTGCQQCHGVDYSGGIANSSCLPCHPNTPEDCAVCHGGVDNQTGAPPEDLAGDTNTDATGVGAHTEHLSEGTLNQAFECGTCHVVPEALYDPGHVDSDAPAEVNFTGLALTEGANPLWDGQTCTNSYCHGGFDGGNSSNAPLWTKVDNTQAVCGTCHGLPPGGEHPQGQVATQCSLCHGTVIDETNNIINKSLHINGVADVSGGHPTGWLDQNSTDFHGAFIGSNQWDLTSCQQCHGVDYSGGITNSSCLTCHPNTPEDCVVCHGGLDNQTGAPPEDLAGNTNTDATGVGAHTEHLIDGTLSQASECSICHVVPETLYDSGHVDSDSPAEINFTGLALMDGANPQWGGQTCTNTYCHGDFERGNSSNAPIWAKVDDTQAACGTCHGLPPAVNHPQGDAASQCNLCHGAVVDENRNIIDKSLHLNGETNVIDSHPDGWVDPNSTDFHGQYIGNNQWDLTGCQGCHGADYSGGITNTSCLTCHPATPEDCVVCHGGVDNQTGAPPEDLAGNTSTDATGVGAHTEHLSDGSLSVAFECGICHVVPNNFIDPGHVDSDSPAEISFTSLALIDSANAQWDGETCANSYCHGNWSLAKSASDKSFMYSADNMTGNNYSPNWTKPPSGTCGTCHALPPVGHTDVGLDICGDCHSSVVDNNGTIIDKTKHVNGLINVFGEEYPMF